MCPKGFQGVLESSSDLWGPWLRSVGAILRQLSLGRKDCTFNSVALSLPSIFIKIYYLNLAWMDATPVFARQNLKEPLLGVKCCIQFLGPSTSEEPNPDDSRDDTVASLLTSSRFGVRLIVGFGFLSYVHLVVFLLFASSILHFWWCFVCFLFHSWFIVSVVCCCIALLFFVIFSYLFLLYHVTFT